MPVPNTSAQIEISESLAAAAERLMLSGGNERIVPDVSARLNNFQAPPRHSDIISYSSSTANDISQAAFKAVERCLAPLSPAFTITSHDYAVALDGLRKRIRAAYRLRHDTPIAFATSGSDLEYVGLALASRNSTAGTDNILLGVEEISRGASYTSAAQFFGRRTAFGKRVISGEPTHPEMAERVRVRHVPVRTATGVPLPAEDVMLDIASAIDDALRLGRHPLVHIVHGSKTGLIAPSLPHLDALRRRYGRQISLVVDACQGRIGPGTINDYLARGAAVLLTGSKFLGAPPGTGFALVPPGTAAQVEKLACGFDRIFARAEWPDDWPGRDTLPDEANLGLLLRLEAAIFELEVFQTLSAADVRRTVEIFNDSVQNLTKRLGIPRLSLSSQGDWQSTAALPVEVRTLVTLDLSQLPSRPDLDRGRWFLRALGAELNLFGLKPSEKAAAKRPIRLGAPVKCISLPDNRFGATLSIGLSMPQMVELASLDNASLEARLKSDMEMIAAKIAIIDAM